MGNGQNDLISMAQNGALADIANKIALIVNTDPSGKVRSLNPFFTEVTQYQTEDLLHHNYFEIISNLSKNSMATIFAKVKAGDLWKGELKLKTKDEKIVWIDSVIASTKSANGELAGLCFFQYDITVRKELEQQHANYLLYSEEIKQRMNLAAEASDMGIWEWDILNDCMYWDDRMYGFLGLQVGEVPVSYIVLQNFVEEEDKEYFELTFSQAIFARDKMEITFRVKQVSGELRYLHFSGKVFQDDSARPLRMVGTCRDITEQIDSQKEQEKLKQELLHTQKIDSIGRLAGGIAHDFNNILGGILGYASLLQDLLIDQPILYEKMVKIEKAAERGAELTKQLLGYARKGKYEKSSINMNHVIKEVRDLLQSLVGKNIQINVDLANDLNMVEGDATQFLQVLMNLGINARDAMPQGGTINIKTENFIATAKFCKTRVHMKAGVYVKTTFSDTGSGIPKAILDKIFDPFFTTKDVGKGTGLGLSMVDGIIKSHQGDLILKSEMGVGTTFELYLPANLSKTQKLATIEKNKKFTAEQFLNLSVLIVDDELVMRELVQDILAPFGTKTFLASSGYEALEIYKNHANEISMVFLDVIMPTMDGISTYHELRKVNPEARILFTSGYTESEDLVVLRQQGKVDFLQKPYKESQILDKIIDVFQGHFNS